MRVLQKQTRHNEHLGTMHELAEPLGLPFVKGQG